MRTLKCGCVLTSKILACRLCCTIHQDMTEFQRLERSRRGFQNNQNTPAIRRVHCCALVLVCLVLELCAGIRVRVVKPKAGERIIASITDGFLMQMLITDMDVTRQNCSELTFSVVEGPDELFTGE